MRLITSHFRTTQRLLIAGALLASFTAASAIAADYGVSGQVFDPGRPPHSRANTAGADTPSCPSLDPRCPPPWQTGSPPPSVADRAAPKKSALNAEGVPVCTSVRHNLANKTGSAPVDINVASREALVKVPGVSATAAQQIIGERSKSKFSSWDDVLQRAAGMRCTDFTGSALRVGPTGFGRGADPKSPGW